MHKRKTPRSSLDRSAAPLYQQIRGVLESARAGAYRAVNATMVQAYWNVGRLIVEHEQGGRRRAAYGEAVLDDLSRRLTADFGKGFTTTNLKYMRSFYVAFPIRHALRDESAAAEKVNALRPELSWTHYRLLLGVEEPKARAWYMSEAADQHWSTRQLERQISVLVSATMPGAMDQLLQQFQSQIRELCAKHHVRRLEVFGSAARGADFAVKSDIDFLAEFEPVADVVYKDSFFGLLHDLEDLLGRRIDLVDTVTVDNALFLRAVEPDRQVVYAG